MWKDEIVEQVRAERERIAAKHGQDLAALIRGLRERQARSEDREVVSLPPRATERTA
jgi:hypothetical protein